MNPEDKVRATEQTRAAGSTIEPQNEVVSFWLILRSNKQIVISDLRLFLQSEIPTVHLKLSREIIVSLKLGNLILIDCCHDQGDSQGQ